MILNIYGFYQLIWLMPVLRKIYNLRLCLPAIFIVKILLVFFSMILSIHLLDGKGKWLWLLYFCWCASREVRLIDFMPFVRFINSYSCASYEARPSRRMRQLCSKTFLLTRLLRGATGPRQSGKTTMLISTHAPLARRDEAQILALATAIFLLTRLLRGATNATFCSLWTHIDFYSRASREARHGWNQLLSAGRNFYSRASCEARQNR